MWVEYLQYRYANIKMCTDIICITIGDQVKECTLSQSSRGDLQHFKGSFQCTFSQLGSPMSAVYLLFYCYSISSHLQGVCYTVWLCLKVYHAYEHYIINQFSVHTLQRFMHETSIMPINNLLTNAYLLTCLYNSSISFSEI